MKIAIAKNGRGLTPSNKACLRYFDLIGADVLTRRYKPEIANYKIELNGTEIDWWSHDLRRDDLALIQVIEELGEEINTVAQHYRTDIGVVEIPDDVEWHIGNDKGEYVAENHRVWFLKDDKTIQRSAK